MKRILFVGGGTGGHFYPLIAVAEVLQKHRNEVELYYMGPEPYNADALKVNGINFIYCPAGKLRIYFSIQNFFDAFRNFFGIFIALFKLYSLYPDVILSKGGYTSVPVLLAARFLRIPIVIHESDTVPGRANKLAKDAARYVAISYPEALSSFDPEKTALIGIPIRQEVKEVINNPFEVLGIPNDLPLIYVTGGSSGAEKINNIILRCLDELLPNYRIFHQVGKGQKNSLVDTAQTLISNPDLQSRYFVEESIPGSAVNALMTASSIIITRAGSTTLFEIAIHGKPCIVIPIPEDVSRDQRSNAYAYAGTGAASVIEEQNLTETLLTSEINAIVKDEARWQKMSQSASVFVTEDAALKLSEVLLKISYEHN